MAANPRRYGDLVVSNENILRTSYIRCQGDVRTVFYVYWQVLCVSWAMDVVGAKSKINLRLYSKQK